MSNGQLATLDDAVVERLKVEERNGFYQPAPALRKGQRVRIEHGAFAGTVCIYEGMTSAERANVLMQLLGQQVRVSVCEKDLVAA